MCLNGGMDGRWKQAERFRCRILGWAQLFGQPWSSSPAVAAGNVHPITRIDLRIDRWAECALADRDRVLAGRPGRRALSFCSLSAGIDFDTRWAELASLGLVQFD